MSVVGLLSCGKGLLEQILFVYKFESVQGYSIYNFIRALGEEESPVEAQYGD